MKEPFASQVEHLVMERTGLKLRLRQRETLQINLAARISALNLKDEDEYFRLLRDGGLVAELEWQHHARLLTNKESYFFRDKGQIALLRDHILPELIERNRSRKTLRMWSAGCSTGEEAYTLSMLAGGLLPRLKFEDWQISIIGTDIDGKALNHARKGLYGSWSFRMVDPATRLRFFRHHGEGWQVLEPYLSSVEFKNSNLVADDFPNRLTGLCDMDLILCRNVFIYFDDKAVATVLDKFAQTLRDGGYLMTGHVETRGVTESPLNTISFPESEIYQKKSAQRENPKDVQTQRTAASALSLTLNAAQVPDSLTTTIHEPQDHQTAEVQDQRLLTQAREFADLGKYVEAVDCCLELTREYPFMAEPYELLASMAQEQGRNEEAKDLLKKALYLSPEEPYLYMELGTVYSGEGDTAKAHKMYQSARELLRHLPHESLVGFSGGASVRECIQHLTELMGGGG
jgi:chemotaxis protein methyltransferase CheR